MRITHLEIKNFRNIGQASYVFEKNPIIFGGKNGIGKSNTLNALIWVVTGTLLTDKYGEGENDLDTIVPKNHKKGMHTEVSITFENGTKFTKVYKTSFSRDGGKANGHTTERFINNVIQNKIEDFEKNLYECFGFKEVFKAPGVKEVNLFVDPLYAFQKLNPSTLRGLLAKLGCEISNEEIYKAGFQDLKEYESKYLGKFDTMKKDLTSEVKKIKAKLTEQEAILKTVAEIEEFDSTKLNELNKAKEKLLKQKILLESGVMDSSINDFEYRIKELKLKKETEMQKEIASIDSELKLFDDKLQIANEKIANQIKSKTSALKDEIQKLKSQEMTCDANVSNITQKLSFINSKIKQMINEAKELKQRKSDMAVKLTAVIGRTYNNYFVCPECGCSFPASEEDKERFENEKRVEIEDLKKNISTCENKISELQKACSKEDLDYKDLTSQRDVLAIESSKIKIELLAKEKQLEAVEKEPVDNTEALEIIKSCEELMAKKNNVSSKYLNYDQDIMELESKKNMLITNNQEKIKLEVIAIESQIADLECDISAETIKQSKWEDKKGWLKEQEENTRVLNDKEFLLGRVTAFINEMISRLNKKATEKTGIEFVMLEENLTNVSLNPVCYALIDGVEFKSVNTAKKLEVGIKFIERLKEIALEEFGVSNNDLPILADRLEGFDSLEKIKSLTNEQFICTRVSNEETITIL